jgi:hypothetical protein
MIQVIRHGAAVWRVTRVTELPKVGDEPAHEYEGLGQIVLDGGLFWAERTRWEGERCTYEREGRGHLLQRGALAVLSAERLRS